MQRRALSKHQMLRDNRSRVGGLGGGGGGGAGLAARRHRARIGHRLLLGEVSACLTLFGVTGTNAAIGRYRKKRGTECVPLDCVLCRADGRPLGVVLFCPAFEGDQWRAGPAS